MIYHQLINNNECKILLKFLNKNIIHIKQIRNEDY